MLEFYVESSDNERYLSFEPLAVFDLEKMRLSLSADDAERLGRDLILAAQWLDMHRAKATVGG